MEREACACDHGFERSDSCAEIIIIFVPTSPTSPTYHLNFDEKWPTNSLPHTDCQSYLDWNFTVDVNP